jgi:hypothetical protein
MEEKAKFAKQGLEKHISTYSLHVRRITSPFSNEMIMISTAAASTQTDNIVIIIMI